MAKVFTIAPGLENMGAMRTGGQGSVYKGRRIGEIITAIKLLPTPIHSESDDDRNYRDFKNEVQKLKRVNEQPNPNVVKILSSGLSETGNFPFIEMEYIEGPDLEELLRPPHDPVFSIKEVLKVAEHLSGALAHCHRLNVKHGDIKSNNVKFNIHTGNYMLLDFGLAIMSDEQRRTSLRQAGAVEFMAPEQNEGQMLFETDVYSFGVVLFELLTGRVPFPLGDKGETARNAVRLAHIESPVPEILPLRRDVLPAGWPVDRKAREMQVPEWLIQVIAKCLQKQPGRRFANGVVLHEHIINHIAHTSNIAGNYGDERQLLQYRQTAEQKEAELQELKNALSAREDEIARLRQQGVQPAKGGVPSTLFILLLVVTLALGAYSAYSYLQRNKSVEQLAVKNDSLNVEQQPGTGESNETEPLKKPKLQDAKVVTPVDTLPAREEEVKDTYTSGDSSQETPATSPPQRGSRYRVVTPKSFFYNSPDTASRRNAFVIQADNAVLTALDDQNGFIYVVFTNQMGQTSRGWLQKKDLQLVNE